tara:strand:+ start:928 stop:1098 length:171 start_codon:yes stop_codon:yes gene_type:complete
MAEQRIRVVIHAGDGLLHIPASLVVIADQGLHKRSVPPGFWLIWEGFNTGIASVQG